MYAIIRTGGKQYKVAKDDVIAVEKIAADPGQSITLNDVLALGDAGSITLGSPIVAGAEVKAEVAEQTRGDKIIVFKKKRRKNYRRKYGHRQCLTMLKIVDIKAAGKAVVKKTASESSEHSSSKKPAQAKSNKNTTDIKNPTKKKTAAKKAVQQSSPSVQPGDDAEKTATVKKQTSGKAAQKTQS